MINSRMQREALEIVKEIHKINFNFGGRKEQGKIDRMSASLIIEMCRDLCQKQITECSDNAIASEFFGNDIYENNDGNPYLVVSGVKETKNVCDSEFNTFQL